MISSSNFFIISYLLFKVYCFVASWQGIRFVVNTTLGWVDNRIIYKNKVLAYREGYFSNAVIILSNELSIPNGIQHKGYKSISSPSHKSIASSDQKKACLPHRHTAVFCFPSLLAKRIFFFRNTPSLTACAKSDLRFLLCHFLFQI